MPAPLGKVPTRKMPNIEVFGIEDSQATRAAVRFFRERRIVVRYVDLRKKPLSRAELRRFVDLLGATVLIEVEDVAPEDVDRAHLPTEAGAIVARLLTDVRLLRLPLVRYGESVTAGQAEATWRAWLARPT